MFSDLKNGYQVHVLTAVDGKMPEYKAGKLVAHSEPRFLPPGDPMSPYGRVMDITVDCGDGNKTYTVPESQNVAKASGVTLSVSVEPVMNELESMKRVSQDVLDSVDFHKGRLEACESILEEINPAFRQTKEQDRKIAGIERQVGDLAKSFDDLKKLIVERLK